MRWVWAASLSFGLAACEDPQPDVSAHTILNLIAQTEGQIDILPLTLGALYEHVHVLYKSDTATAKTITIQLGRDNTEDIAQLHCDTFFNAPRAPYPVIDTLNTLIIQPIPPEHRRVVCQFTYSDQTNRVQNFLTQAEMWSLSHIGETKTATQENAHSAKIAQAGSPTRALSLIHQTLENSHAAELVFLIDLR